MKDEHIVTAQDGNAELRPSLGAGVVEYELDPGYRWPEDPLVLERLERWRDAKFGVIVHWGLYSLLGEDGSWTLCRSRDEECMLIPGTFTGGDDAWQRYYEDARTRFLAENFDAEQLAQAISDAGARYAVITAKHHDGFSMYDTAHSDYKSTSVQVPFGRDFVGEMSIELAKQDVRLGLYFSKADWHHAGYWTPDRPIIDRFRNHDDPAKWEEFVQFSHSQISELLTKYGEIEVLWLDAGWVKGPREDLAISGIAEAARTLQPGILVVDREVHNSVEDYRTPEQQIPGERLDYPWESCITLTDHWCTVPEPGPQKSTFEVIQMLVTVVARGGNLLLGVGPDGTGELPEGTVDALAGIGRWLDRFGGAIFETRPVTPGLISGNGTSENFRDHAGRVWWLTQTGNKINLVWISEGQTEQAPITLQIPLSVPPVGVHGVGAEVRGSTWQDGFLEMTLILGDQQPDKHQQAMTTIALSIDLTPEVEGSTRGG